MSFAANLEMGHAAEVRWCRFLDARGNVSIPIYGATEVDDSTKAPVLFAVDGIFVSPDILCLRRDGTNTWHEVKAKAEPSWRYAKPGPRWEHGIDKALIDEYRKAEEKTGIPVWIVVFETRSPIDDGNDSELVDSGIWLTVPLAGALIHGEHRPTWPGGRNDPRRGRGGQGGWLWPRSIMVRVDELAEREAIMSEPPRRRPLGWVDQHKWVEAYEREVKRKASVPTQLDLLSAVTP